MGECAYTIDTGSVYNEQFQFVECYFSRTVDMQRSVLILSTRDGRVDTVRVWIHLQQTTRASDR